MNCLTSCGVRWFNNWQIRVLLDLFPLLPILGENGNKWSAPRGRAAGWAQPVDRSAQGHRWAPHPLSPHRLQREWQRALRARERWRRTIPGRARLAAGDITPKDTPRSQCLPSRGVCPFVRFFPSPAGEGSSPLADTAGHRGATGPGRRGRAKAAREGGPRQATEWNSAQHTTCCLSCLRWSSALGESGSVRDLSQGALLAGWSYCRSPVGAKDSHFSCLYLPPKLESLSIFRVLKSFQESRALFELPQSLEKVSAFRPVRRPKAFPSTDCMFFPSSTSKSKRYHSVTDQNKEHRETRRELSPGSVFTLKLS